MQADCGVLRRSAVWLTRRSTQLGAERDANMQVRSAQYPHTTGRLCSAGACPGPEQLRAFAAAPARHFPYGQATLTPFPERSPGASNDLAGRCGNLDTHRRRAEAANPLLPRRKLLSARYKPQRLALTESSSPRPPRGARGPGFSPARALWPLAIECHRTRRARMAATSKAPAMVAEGEISAATRSQQPEGYASRRVVASLKFRERARNTAHRLDHAATAGNCPLRFPATLPARLERDAQMAAASIG